MCFVKILQQRPARPCFALALWLAAAGTGRPEIASSNPAGTPQSWIMAAAMHEREIINTNGKLPLRYKVRKIDSKGDMLREVIDTPQGAVARLLERDGKPITAAQDAAEKQRLEDILASPDAFIKHHKRDDTARIDSLQLVAAMPTAMIYTYAEGQPQTPGSATPQVVLDFRPDPAFRPGPMVADLLTGLAGRLWIDARTQHLVRADAHVVKPVNFGWGVVARLSPGGTITLEQVDAGNGHWVFSRLDEHFSVRAVMLKNMPQNTRMTASDFRELPHPVDSAEAVHLLLAMPIALR